MAEQAESPKIVGLAKRVLALAVVVVCREEFGGYYLAAVLNKANALVAAGRPRLPDYEVSSPSRSKGRGEE